MRDGTVRSLIVLSLSEYYIRSWMRWFQRMLQSRTLKKKQVMSDMSISLLADAIRDHFFRSELLKRVEAIAERGLMCEGWFKAELVYLFSEMVKEGTIKSWECECSVVGKGRIDFRLRLLEEETVVIEVLAAPTRNSNGTPYRLTGYDHPNCDGEIPKMLAAPANSHFLLLFAYPPAPAEDWYVLAKRIERRCPGHTLTVSRVDLSQGMSIGWLAPAYMVGAVSTGI